MDEISREVAADTTPGRGVPGRTKGPEELALLDRGMAAEAPPVTGPRERGTAGRASGPRRSAAPEPEADASGPGAADGPIDRAAAEAAAAAEETAMVDAELGVPDAADGLPPVPELQDPAAIARVVFVLLLTQREGVTLFRLAQSCNTTQKLVEAALPRLEADLQQLGLPVELQRAGDSVRLLCQPEVFPYLQRLRGVKKLEKLSPAALETLAVIAYRQPVMRSEIEAIRGVKAGPMLRTLLQHKLVRVTGRADVPGRPLQYGTTQQFLERFGLASLNELPSIKEFKQLG
jgi:segregation and condensation protein B